MERLAAVPRLESRPRAAHRAAPPTPAEHILRLQRTAGNRAVARMLQRYPRMPRGGGPTATDLVGPVTGPFEGAVSSDTYEHQPAALRRVLDGSARDGSLYWIGLDREERSAVTQLYNRLQRLGLWSHAKRIRKVVKGTPPWCGFWVQGDTPSVELEGDTEGLVRALTASHKMCFDAGIGGSLHPGQHSFREVSETDSLHVSVGATDETREGRGQFSTAGRQHFDVHIDRHASPNAKKGLACEYDPTRTAAHQGREVVPGMLGKPKNRVRIGGFEIFPEDPTEGVRPEMFQRGDERDKAPMIAGFKWRFRGPWGM